MHPELAFGAFLASALVLVPLPWHWRARNVATLSIIAWLFVSNLTFAINSIIWAGNVNEVVPVWCDIVSKLEVGATAALPACCLSLALQLWRVAATTCATSRRNILVLDLILCWGYPIITMALHYIVQGHRFDIVEDFGCRPTTYVSIPAILVLYGPIAIVVVLIFIYSALAFASFYQRRRTFTTFLQTKKSAFTTRRYVRLMAITIVLAVWDTVVIAVIFSITFLPGLLPYTSWADVHFDFSRVDKYPAVDIAPGILFWTYVSWWTIPLSGYSFFCFFSFGEDAVAQYGPWFRWVSALPGKVSCITTRQWRQVRRNKSPPGRTPSFDSQAHLSLPRWTEDFVLDIKPEYSFPSSEARDGSEDRCRNSIGLTAEVQ